MERTVTVLNEEGLHARPAGLLVKKAAEFQSAIEFRANGMTKSAKSIMGLMGLGLAHGNQVTLVADGADADQALAALARLFERRFAPETEASPRPEAALK